MFGAVERLKNERRKLAGERKQINTEIDTEIRKIDTAIEKFTEGLQALAAGQPKARSASAEIEVILREAGRPLTVREIHTELVERRGFTIAFQSISATLTRENKRRGKYKRVAPATFALRDDRRKSVSVSKRAGGR